MREVSQSMPVSSAGKKEDKPNKMKNIFVSKVTDLTYGHPGNDPAWADVHRQVVIVRDPIGPCIISSKTYHPSQYGHLRKTTCPLHSQQDWYYIF